MVQTNQLHYWDYKVSNSEEIKNQIREAAESDLEAFIRLLAPYRVLGSIHREVIRWWTRPDAKDHQLLLLPRDHGKSALVAFRVAWHLTRNPHHRVLYISSTSGLAEKQLGFIKNLMETDTYRKYWPDHIHPEEGKREKWTTTEIMLDHPRRKEEGIRDPSIFTGGLTTSLTGLHCDVAVLDDVVVFENAYTAEGRQKVARQYSLLSSIEGGEAQEWVVGTRYHPKDLYQEMEDTIAETFDEDGNITGQFHVYETMNRQVEDRGDGTGEFLWPRQKRDDGVWFGFNAEILAKKRAKYKDKMQYRAQYYNDPNDPDDEGIPLGNINYYDKKFLSRRGGYWYIKDRRLNVFASIDFAYSLSKVADYTAIVVIGMDVHQNIYILEIDRFKTGQVDEYFRHILDLHQRWGFRKLRAEATAAQDVIINTLKDLYIKQHALALTIEKHKPNRNDGTKEERIYYTLKPWYSEGKMFHYEGGNCQLLEEELAKKMTSHDDIKDALHTVIEIAKPPTKMFGGGQAKQRAQKSFNRFGGWT